MSVRIIQGDCRAILRTLPDESVHCVVTSPPYFGLRDYGNEGQTGLEPTPDAYVDEIVGVFQQVRRVLRSDGTVWLNLGDSYAGSGRGGNPTAESSTLEGGQSSQKASMVRRSIRGSQLPAGFHEAARQAGALGRAWIPPPLGLKRKDLMGIPWRVAFALQADGWWLRQDIIWAKPNPMPESVTDRCTKAHEYVFLLSKSERYAYDGDAIKEVASGTEARPQQVRAQELAKQHGLTAEHIAAIRACGVTDVGKAQTTQDGFGKNTEAVIKLAAEAKAALGGYYREFLMAPDRNRRSVWSVASEPFSDAHFATFPPALIEPCIKAGCPQGGTVLDPFGGAGTTGLVADRLGRDAILIELNPDYCEMARKRIEGDAPLLAEVIA